MAGTNGKVRAGTARKVAEQAAYQPRMYRLTSDELNGRDIKRARIMLDGRNPWEVLDDDDDRFTLIIWCLKSRHIPEFTWDDAEATPYGEFLPPGDLPPQTPPLETSGSSETGPSENDSSATQPKPEPEPSSASSSA
jgi:hypothetical protein